MFNKITDLREHKASEEGFTLIELIIVVVIIGILAAIAIPAFLTHRANAVEAGMHSDTRNTSIAIKSAEIAHQGFQHISNITPEGVEPGMGERFNLYVSTPAKPIPTEVAGGKLNVSSPETKIQVEGNWDDWTILTCNYSIEKALVLKATSSKTIEIPWDSSQC